MGRCGCEMMIECEVKICQTVESIENTRREGGKMVGKKICGGVKWNEETRVWIEEIIQDLSRK